MPKAWKMARSEGGGIRENLEVSVSDTDAKFFAAEMNKSTPTLDLHAFTSTDATYELDLFLHQQQMAGTEVVRIMTGKGTGTLREVVNNWLAQQKESGSLVLAYKAATDLRQQTAVVYVMLEKLD